VQGPSGREHTHNSAVHAQSMTEGSTVLQL
jgi:hypothetical protein